jgi:DNA-binding CsgD family transcriptional regulator/PAS domain-containing protein
MPESQTVGSISPQALSTLIGSIYDCVLDPSRWDQTLTRITDALETQTAALSLTDLRHDQFLIFRTVGIEPYWLEQTAKHVPEMHAVLSQALASWPSLDEPHVISRHVPRAYVETSPYFQQCLKPQGIVDVIQYFILQTPSRLAGFGMARHERHGIITDREVQLSGLLLPHVRRAVMISDVLDVKTIERTRMAEALDGLRCAVMLTDVRGTVLYANGSAEAMLRAGGLVQSAGGVLQAKAPTATAELRAAIALAAQDEARIGKTGLAICLTEPSVPPIHAHVLPLTGSDLRTRLQPAAVAGVFIGAPPDAQDGAQVTAAAHGLTPAETRVLASLLAGRTLAQTAAALGVAPATAKSHLDSIFAKTGVSRQADLMLLASGLVPPTKG